MNTRRDGVNIWGCLTGSEVVGSNHRPMISKTYLALRHDHIIIFAHKVLPAHLWNGDSVLGILANPENQEFIVNLWNELGQKLAPGNQLPSHGIRHSSHWIGGEHLVILIELPPVEIPPEARFIAITTSPIIRYFTLEKSVRLEDGSDMYVIAEWQENGTHRNFGAVEEPTASGFLKAICRLMSLPEMVEPPTIQQLFGMSRDVEVIDQTIPERLTQDDEQKVQAWKQEAEAAFEAEDYPRAERNYRQILDLRMTRQGPENTFATLAYAQLAQISTLQGKYAEAEELCLKWWHYCRRYRMLGHSETMSAIRSLANCLRAQGRIQESKDLMSYRVLLAGLSRGTSSLIAIQANSELLAFL